MFKSQREKGWEGCKEEKIKDRGLTVPDYKIYHKATVTKTVWCWQKNSQIDQWDRIEGSCKYSKLISDKEVETIQWLKGHLFKKLCRNCWTPTPRHRPCTVHKNWLKMGHRPKLKTQNYKTPGWRCRNDLQYGNDFLAITPKAQSVKSAEKPFPLLPQPQLLALGVGKRDCACSVATRGTKGKEDDFVDVWAPSRGSQVVPFQGFVSESWAVESSGIPLKACIFMVVKSLQLALYLFFSLLSNFEIWFKYNKMHPF